MGFGHSPKQSPPRSTSKPSCSSNRSPRMGLPRRAQVHPMNLHRLHNRYQSSEFLRFSASFQSASDTRRSAPTEDFHPAVGRALHAQPAPAPSATPRPPSGRLDGPSTTGCPAARVSCSAGGREEAADQRSFSSLNSTFCRSEDRSVSDLIFVLDASDKGAA